TWKGAQLIRSLMGKGRCVLEHVVLAGQGTKKLDGELNGTGFAFISWKVVEDNEVSDGNLIENQVNRSQRREICYSVV
ncbi:hypothetical protein Tco_1325004, partial [Tanacetum coccineum]